MSKFRKILIISLCGLTFIFSTLFNMPAWLMGSLIERYSNAKISLVNEQGKFWNGSGLLIAQNLENRTTMPLLEVNWKIKLGLTKFLQINLTSAGDPVAEIDLTKTGISINQLNLAVSLDQISPFLGNLNSLNLSGNLKLTANNLHLAKQNQGTIQATLTEVGSGMSPVNPFGNYDISLDLATLAITVASQPNSVIIINSSGNLNSLILNLKVQADKKEQLLQFMTMMGMPQADGSYQMKVF
jgi:hypothetical protein